MKKKDAFAIAVMAILFAAIILLVTLPVSVTGEELADSLILSCTERALGTAIVILALCAFIGKDALAFRLKGTALAWCLPCLAVAIVNFPFSALISGTAHLDFPSLIPLFALDCLLTGVFEELLFRGALQRIIFDFAEKYRFKSLITVAVTSLLFGGCHLLNLFGGAGVGATLLQAGYSFLIGAMLSCTLLKTGNIWICAALHAIFNFGGLLVPALGSGVFQDACFWTLTAIFGLLCAGHVTFFLVARMREERNDNPREGEGGQSTGE